MNDMSNSKDPLKTEIEKAREIAGRATHGPWEECSDLPQHGAYSIGAAKHVIATRNTNYLVKRPNYGCELHDANYIAHMHPIRTQAWADCLEMAVEVLEFYSSPSNCVLEGYKKAHRTLKKIRERIEEVE